MIYYILLIVLILIMIGLSLFYIPLAKSKNMSRSCPGYLNPKSNSCFFNGSLKLPFSSSCDPPNEKLYIKELTIFLIELQLILEENRKTPCISIDTLKS